VAGLATVALFDGLTSGAALGNGFMRTAAYVLFPALTSYIALQFTGSTTYTGMSGVKKELKMAVPAYFTAIGLSVLLVITYKLQTWGVL
jgi:hypothetical protein